MCDWQMYHGTMLLLLYNSCSPFLSFHAVFSGYVFLLFFEIPFHTKKVRCRSVCQTIAKIWVKVVLEVNAASQ